MCEHSHRNCQTRWHISDHLTPDLILTTSAYLATPHHSLVSTPCHQGRHLQDLISIFSHIARLGVKCSSQWLLYYEQIAVNLVVIHPVGPYSEETVT
jgi:hypothetical protein